MYASYPQKIENMAKFLDKEILRVILEKVLDVSVEKKKVYKIFCIYIPIPCVISVDCSCHSIFLEWETSNF